MIQFGYVESYLLRWSGKLVLTFCGMVIYTWQGLACENTRLKHDKHYS